jgi:hypothetical protein
MTKRSGLGMNCYVGGYDLSGDVGGINNLRGGPSPLTVTGIDKEAFERIGGLRDGAVEYMSYFNKATGQAHLTLSALPRTDQITTVCVGTTLGYPAAAIVAKQINYDGTRAQDGSLTLTVQALGNGNALEWGRQLTAGKRTDTSATNGSSIDTAASADFGAQAYLQVFAVTGTSVTCTIEDSANDSAFTAVAGLAFTAATGVTTQRLATSNTATIRRYLRVATTGTFSNAVFNLMIVKNEIAGVAF